MERCGLHITETSISGQVPLEFEFKRPPWLPTTREGWLRVHACRVTFTTGATLYRTITYCVLYGYPGLIRPL
jgi:hypothetical protein